MSYESLTIATPEASRRKRGPAPGAEVSLTDEERREVARRKEVAELAKRAAELDRELFGSILAAETPAEALEKIETIESLSFGKEIERHEVGEKGVNAITRRIYEGDPPRSAYVKPRMGEQAFVYDEKQKRIFQATNVWDAEQNRFIEERNAPALEDFEIEGLISEIQQRSARKERIASRYGITPEEVPLSDTQLTKRFGVEAGEGAIREYVASRISEFVHFDVVQLTALRAEKDNIDLSSVQEAVKATDPDDPIRQISDDEMRDLIMKGPDGPGARSFMRIACLDYLIKTTDRGFFNMLYDPSSEQFTAIDNGFSMGLSERTLTPEEQAATIPIEPYLSIPLEAIQFHPDWKLDDEALATLFELYESVKEYLSEREKDLTERQLKGGKEIKYLTKLFRLLYGNEQIAKREALDFMARIKKIIDLGRPPLLKQGEIQPYLAAWMVSAR